MDFFESQSTNRRESAVMLLAFAAVFLLCFILVYSLASLISVPIARANSGMSIGLVKACIIAPFVIVVGGGCFKRWRDVSGGGQQIAQRLGAQLIVRDSNIRENTQLLNLVEELSIAAGVTAPICFCLETESSINAFVAGNAECTALIVTQGSLDKLDKDEMRAVVAHEIGHIANNDLGISMRLLIALGGLNAISEAGYKCFDSIKIKTKSSYSRSHFKRENNMGAAMLAVVVGTFLCLLGGVFVFFGDLLKSAFTRKRELLADAKAVQFTRNTWGLASALNKIAESNVNHSLHSRYAGEVAHICISAPSEHYLFPKLLATHPTLETRISKIDPHFDVKNRHKTRKQNAKNAVESKPADRTKVSPAASIAPAGILMSNCSAEIGILLSFMIQTSGNNESTCMAKYASTLKCYTNEPLPMRKLSEPDVNAEFETALDTLLQLPAIQRQNLLTHIKELMDHDGIQLEAEVNMLNHICDRLNPPSKAA